jgi:hypothetical protein
MLINQLNLDQNKKEVLSMKTQTITNNALSSSLNVAGAIGVNVYAAYLLA